VYTQNIDTLERETGIDPNLIVEAHGSYASCHCTHCNQEYSQEWFSSKIMDDQVPICHICDMAHNIKENGERTIPKKVKCDEHECAINSSKDQESFHESIQKTLVGYVKPDITFFGEDLPPRFGQLRGNDLGKNCDLLIILGFRFLIV